MRRLLAGLVVAATTAITPMFVWAGNQEMAEEIAKGLRASGQLQNYRIGIKYQDGTATLRGQVTSEDQMRTAMTLASQMPGVTNVVNGLTVVPSDQPANPQAGQLTSGASSLQPEQVRRFNPNVLGATSAQNQPIPAEATQNPTMAQRLAVNFLPGPAKPTSVEVPTAAAPKPISPVKRASPVATVPTRNKQPLPVAFVQQAPAEGVTPAAPTVMPQGQYAPPAMMPCPVPNGNGGPLPAYVAPGVAPAPAQYDNPAVPGYAWPTYAAYPNYAAVTYPRQYSPTAWPYIGPFYPYPQVPLGWRKVCLEWDDGWWMLDFKDRHH